MLPEIREVFAALQAYVAAVRQGSMINQSAPLAVPEVGSRASSGRAWQFWLARRSHGRDRPTGRQATASRARASGLQSRRFPAIGPSGKAGRPSFDLGPCQCLLPTFISSAIRDCGRSSSCLFKARASAASLSVCLPVSVCLCVSALSYLLSIRYLLS